MRQRTDILDKIVSIRYIVYLYIKHSSITIQTNEQNPDRYKSDYIAKIDSQMKFKLLTYKTAQNHEDDIVCIHS